MQPVSDTPILIKRAQSLTRRAYAHLLWEAYAPVLALGVLCVFLFVMGAAFGLWQRFGDPWRLIALVLSLYFVVKSIRKAQKTLRPNRSQARRRVELDNELHHRPLDALVDSPAMVQSSNTNDNLENFVGNKAWQQHLANARRQIRAARGSYLRPALAKIDKYFLRFSTPAVLVLAFMVGYGDNYERLRAALNPGWIYGMSAASANYDAWIDPPAYTGRPPSYFKNQASPDLKNKPMSVPQGSEFVARISGVKTAPRLILRSGNQTRRITTKKLGPQSFEARAFIQKDTTASYRIGKITKIWGLDVAIDTPPSVGFNTPPDAGKRDRLIFTYSLNDDYGVEELILSLALETEPDLSEQISINLPGSAVRTAQKEPGGIDLTHHKWAGKKVIGRLLAVDGKRQVGSSAFHNFIVPDKIFVEPLAKAIAEQRLLMLANTDEFTPVKKEKKRRVIDKPLFAVERPDLAIERAPQNVRRTALLIDALSDKPVGVFDDPSVYMGLRHIYRRLQSARSQSELGGIPEDLWAIALRAEFGRLGDALEDMKRAERALNNAMARRAPQREVDALFDRYNQAVDRYMEFLMLEAAKNAQEQAANNPEGGGGKNFQMEEIEALLAAIEEANRMGDTAAARRALAKLAELLENMQIQLAQGGGSGEGGGDAMSEELKQALEELNDILGEQRRLRDETKDAGRAEADQRSGQNEGQNNDQNGDQNGDQPSGSDLADKQQQIGELLKQLEAGTGEGLNGGEDKENGGGARNNKDGNETGSGALNSEDIKNALKDAKRAMGSSEQALDEGDFFGAGRSQSEAIEALRQAGEGLLAQEAARLEAEKAQDGSQDGDNGSQRSGSGDPFGREGGEGVDDTQIDIDNKSDQQRARELLEELRRRSGESQRDKSEREYLERLLEQF